jgi:hypothetical protein
VTVIANRLSRCATSWILKQLDSSIQPRLKLLSELVSGWLWSSSWAGPWPLLVHTRARTHADVQTHIHIHIYIHIFMNIRIFNRHIAYLIPMQKQTNEHNSTHIVPMRGADWRITIKNISAVKSHDSLWRSGAFLCRARCIFSTGRSYSANRCFWCITIYIAIARTLSAFPFDSRLLRPVCSSLSSLSHKYFSCCSCGSASSPSPTTASLTASCLSFRFCGQILSASSPWFLVSVDGVFI